MLITAHIVAMQHEVLTAPSMHYTLVHELACQCLPRCSGAALSGVCTQQLPCSILELCMWALCLVPCMQAVQLVYYSAGLCSASTHDRLSRLSSRAAAGQPHAAALAPCRLLLWALPWLRRTA